MTLNRTPELATHTQFLGDPDPITKRVDQLNFGDVIRFTYDGKERLAFVLNPSYFHKCHALDLTLVSRERLLSVVIPPMFRITDPYSFYHSGAGIKYIVKATDSYRTYIIQKMQNIIRYGYSIQGEWQR